MIKFVANKDGPGGPMIGLGLSRDNVRLLKEGRPIVVELAPLGLSPGKVMLFYGKTEAALAKALLPFISEETTVSGTETL